MRFPPILRHTFTTEQAFSNLIWGLIYGSIGSLTPVLLHTAFSGLTWPWLLLSGFSVFALLAAWGMSLREKTVQEAGAKEGKVGPLPETVAAAIPALERPITHLMKAVELHGAVSGVLTDEHRKDLEGHLRMIRTLLARPDTPIEHLKILAATRVMVDWEDLAGGSLRTVQAYMRHHLPAHLNKFSLPNMAFSREDLKRDPRLQRATGTDTRVALEKYERALDGLLNGGAAIDSQHAQSAVSDPAQLRRAIDRAMVQLRKQRDMVWEWRLHEHLDPDERGEWETEDRKGVLHQDPRFRRAFQATEDAFNAISLMRDPTNYHRETAVEKIDIALGELETASELIQ